MDKDEKSLVDKEKLEYEIFDHKKLALSKHHETVKRRMTILGQKVTTQINEEGSYSVLANQNSKLAACFIDEESMKIFTIDIHCLIRQWDVKTGNCVRSYILETPS